MDYNQILDAVIKLIIIPVIPYLGKWLRKLVKIQIERAKKELEKYEIEKFAGYSSLLEDMAYNAVEHVQSRSARGNTLLTKERLSADARKIVKDQITEQDRKLLQARLNDPEAYIDMLVDNILMHKED